jgi:hypothetical protein
MASPHPASPPSSSLPLLQIWARLVRQQSASVLGLWDELASLEAAAYARFRRTGQELADLGADTVSDATRLAALWRRMGIAATRRGAALLGLDSVV